MASRATSSRTLKPEPDWELVYKRNPVERIKRDKSPLGILDELPALIATGYDRVAEEDIVRMKWWGLYHDKPKIGTFMLRIKLPGGRVSPAELRAIGEISNRFGRGDGELSTRQNVQLHWLELGVASGGLRPAATRPVSRPPAAAATPSATSPAARWRGSAQGELFDTHAGRRRGCRVLLRQPRLLEPARASTRSRSPPAPTTATRPRSTASPSSASIHEGGEGFAVRVGGGLSSVPRIARDLGVFVPKEEAIEVLAGAARRLAGGPALPRLARQVAA